MLAFLKRSTEFCLKWKWQEIPDSKTWIPPQFEAPRYAGAIPLPQNPQCLRPCAWRAKALHHSKCLFLPALAWTQPLRQRWCGTCPWVIPAQPYIQISQRFLERKVLDWYFPSLHAGLDTISTTEVIFLFDLEKLLSEYLLKSVKRFMNNLNGQPIGPQTSTMFPWVSAFHGNNTSGCF